MILIVGLGNPDKKYENTRHNVGFMVLDKLASAPWKYSKKFKAEVSRSFIEGQDVMLIKPQTYMNKSGESVRGFVGFLSVPLDRVWMIYDDLDLDLGTVRVRKEGTAGGHKGVLSIIGSLGSKSIPRFRVGINTERSEYVPAEKFVLEKFSNEEKNLLNETLEKTIELVRKSLVDGIEHTSS